MEATSIAPSANSVLPAEIQSAQAQQAPVEQQLFDYLLDNNIAGAATLTNPSALIGSAVESLEGLATQAQNAVEAAKAASPAETGAAPQDAGGATAGAMSPETMGQTLDRAISVMWATANVSLATNSLTAATGSVSTLIKQQ